MTERIRLSGRLDGEGRLTLRPAFRTTIPLEHWRQEPLTYIVEVLDAGGRTLSRVPLSASGTCGSASITLRGSVDLPDDAARLNVLRVDASGRDPIVLVSEGVPESGPALRLLRTPQGTMDGDFVLTWEATGDPAPVRYFVDYSNGREVWEPLATSVGEPRMTIDFAKLAGGQACRVAVTASNGIRSSRVESESFQVTEKPCAAVIQQPVDGARVSPDVALVGNGWWREEGRAELEALAWTSDVQGDLGRGRAVAARLGEGTHRITLRAGHGDRTGEETVTVHVGYVPPATAGQHPTDHRGAGGG